MSSYQVTGIFFDRAHALQIESGNHEIKGHFFLSWVFSTGSRICFLMEFIEDVVAIPFALLSIAFSFVLAQKKVTDQAILFLKQKFHNLPLSLVGSIISPWLVVEKIAKMKYL